MLWQHKGQWLWLTWGPTTPGGPGGPVLPWNPCVIQTKKNNPVNVWHDQNTEEELSIQLTHSFSSLSRMSGQSVFPCRSLRDTCKSMSVSTHNDMGKGVMVVMHMDSQEAPLVLGNLLVPEGLADPKTDNDRRSIIVYPWWKWMHVFLV